MVNNQNPQKSKYSAIAALYSLLAAPSMGFPVVEYEAAIPQEGVWITPNESQKTPNIPQTIMEKKFPIIHSNMQARRRRTGPVK